MPREFEMYKLKYPNLKEISIPLKRIEIPNVYKEKVSHHKKITKQAFSFEPQTEATSHSSQDGEIKMEFEAGEVFCQTKDENEPRQDEEAIYILPDSHFTCSKCTEEFFDEREFESHFKHCEVEDSEDNVIDLEEDEKDPGYCQPEILPNNKKICPICNVTLSGKSRFTRHIRCHKPQETNTLERRFVCAICGLSFLYLNEFKRHNETTHANIKNNTYMRKCKYKCPDCPMVFTTEKYLKSHSTIHSGESKHKCHLCPRSFSSAFHLTSHLVIHGREKPKKSESNDAKSGSSKTQSEFKEKSSKPKTVKCKICHDAFDDNNQLQSHVVKSHGEKIFKCSMCSLSFKRNGDLKKHTMIHSEIKPFKCHLCDKGFSRSNSLTRHIVVHTNIKPFKCETCNDSFTRRYTLKNHLKVYSH